MKKLKYENNQSKLVEQIRLAFKDVKLGEGIGLWEAQGLDDYADPVSLSKLRAKDEREDWDKISYRDLATCASSLSFFDAKGMRFCLPKFLIADIEQDEILKKQGVYAPDVLFTLSYALEKNDKFSLLNAAQIQSVICYLKFKLEEIIALHEEFSKECGTSADGVYDDDEYLKLQNVIKVWNDIYVQTQTALQSSLYSKKVMFF